MEGQRSSAVVVVRASRRSITDDVRCKPTAHVRQLGGSDRMAEHVVDVSWSRGEHEFTYRSYSRDHTWAFDGGDTVTASANPAYLGSEAAVDPEEAFIAALASCHMLTFLAIAAKKRFVVDTYDDHA